MRIGWDMEIHAGPHVQAAALEMGGEHPDKQVAPGSGSGQVRGDVDRGEVGSWRHGGVPFAGW